MSIKRERTSVHGIDNGVAITSLSEDTSDKERTNYIRMKVQLIQSYAT